MAENTSVEKIEANVATAAVVEADRKVANIRAEKEAKKAAKHKATLEKHPKIGRALNWVDDNKWKLLAGVATGGAGFGLGVLWEKQRNRKSEETVEVETEDTIDDETAVEPPFDTEA